MVHIYSSIAEHNRTVGILLEYSMIYKLHVDECVQVKVPFFCLFVFFKLQF